MSKAPFLPVLVAGSLLLTACGSTAATSGGGLQAGSGGQGLGVQGTGGGQPGGNGLGAVASPPGSSSLPQGPAGVGPAGSGSTSAGTAGATAGSGPASGPPAATDAAALRGPGVTATTIALGIPYCNDCATANSAAGAGGQDPGDTRRYYQAALDDVNARGGVLGRKLVPVWHQVSASDNIDTSEQAACETFTKDNKVLAMFFRGEIVYQCARKAGILVMGDGGSGPVYARYPNLFDPASIRLERLGAVTVKAMVRAGWQKPAPKWPTGKIGLITWDSNDYRYSMTKGWLPALHAEGLKETDVRYVAVPQSDKSLADASAGISSAVLAFRQQGIDHVLISDGPSGIFTGTGLTLLFLENAKSQQYYPRYGFNSYNSPGWSNLPADQESGMLAVDAIDNRPEADAGIAANATRNRCWSLMSKRGLNVGDDQTRFLASGACEIAWFSEAVFSRVRSTALSDVIAAAESLGTSYRSPFMFGSRMGPGKHDGAALFRNSMFDDACACMRYSSKPYEP